MKKAITLFSGGLDSSTVLAIANQENYLNYALSFDYNQRHKVELEVASKFIANNSKKFNIIEHKVAKIDLSIFANSALLNQSLEVLKNRDLSDIKQETSSDKVPNTYVPARNTIFLAFAFGYAETIGADAIFVGVNAVDYSGYPDCRPQFISAFQSLINIAGANNNSKSLQIKAPLIKMSKADIIKKGTELGVDYSMTHSCYDPIIVRNNFDEIERIISCKKCDSCLLRNQGFNEANIIDSV
jgi:7-cyano-7-deazaguanine synthase